MNIFLRGLCLCLWPLVFSMLPLHAAQAVVMYDEDRALINGVSLLRDKEDPLTYYYLPTTPKAVIDPVTGKPKIMLIKFVDPAGDTSGGLVHFLFTLDLPQDEIEALAAELEKTHPGARIAGPVNLRTEADENTCNASFKIISSTLTYTNSPDPFSKNVVISGVAPVTPGAQAAVAARLNPHGATLLWQSLMQPTSDISIAVSASYEAALPAYRGRVYADMSTVYDHMFKVMNQQKDYRKTEIRNQIDELVRLGVIEVDVTDRAGLDIDTGQMSGIMNLVTDKLVNMLFDTTQGFSKLPKPEEVPDDVVQGRQKRGFFGRLFAGSGNQKYITDDQYTLRNRSDIKKATFSLLFTQNTTIRVPYHSSGNIGGFYATYKDDPELFRVVNLNDSSYQTREIFVAVDPLYYSAFQDSINSVSLSFHKAYPKEMKQAEVDQQIIINQADVKDGVFNKSLTYPRLAVKDNSWLQYGHRAIWSFRGGQSLAVPQALDALSEDNAPIINLAPPLDLTAIEIDGDAAGMNAAGIRRAMVTFDYRLLGQAKRKTVPLRPDSEEILQSLQLLHDPGSAIKYRVRWFSKTGPIDDAQQTLTDTYLFLLTPDTGGE